LSLGLRPISVNLILADNFPDFLGLSRPLSGAFRQRRANVGPLAQGLRERQVGANATAQLQK
jgi:hypothetical protein